MEDDEWHKVIDVTLNGTMRMTRYMMKVMKARGQGGVIVNNASVLGWRAQKEQCHYAAAKAAIWTSATTRIASQLPTRSINCPQISAAACPSSAA